MPTVVVALKDILTDEAVPIDLTTLPTDEAAEKIRDIYGFFGPLLDITIDEGVAVITLPEQQARLVDRALARLKEAARAAARGRYDQAIRIYYEVLDLLPTHSDARRELGMAYMENGNARAAKEQLIRAIQLNPKDAWAYLILGNLYHQLEHDPGSAERFFITAIDLAPDDPFILNSYAALLAKRGDTEQASTLFQRAIDAGPDTPRPRYGLALLLAQGGDTDTGIDALEALFARPVSQDVRDEPVYSEARRLYATLRQRCLTGNHGQVMQQLRQAMADYTAESGIEIRLEQDTAIATDSKVELSRRYGRPYHLIKYGDQGLNPYMIAHEFEHILLEAEAVPPAAIASSPPGKRSEPPPSAAWSAISASSAAAAVSTSAPWSRSSPCSCKACPTSSTTCPWTASSTAAYMIGTPGCATRCLWALKQSKR